MERNRRTADDGLKSVAMPVAIETVFCQLCRFQSRRKVLTPFNLSVYLYIDTLTCT